MTKQKFLILALSSVIVALSGFSQNSAAELSNPNQILCLAYYEAGNTLKRGPTYDHVVTITPKKPSNSIENGDVVFLSSPWTSQLYKTRAEVSQGSAILNFLPQYSIYLGRDYTLCYYFVPRKQS